MAGVRLVPGRGGSYLVQEQPLTVLAVRREGLELLESCRYGRELEAVPARELRFLRRLAELELVELRPAAAGPPRVSVVVPVRDRPEQLARCLASLAALDWPHERLEVCVVDDGSARPPSVPEGVRLLRLEGGQGPAAARNAGAGAARGELLAFLDSDCRAEPGWLRELAPEFADPRVAAAGGRVLAGARGTWLERFDAARSPLDLGPRFAVVRPGRPVAYVVTANLLVRRPAFEAAGGFDPELRCGEDVDLAWRLVGAGRRVVYQPRGAVRHDHRGTLRDFARTRMAYAASESPLLRRHPGSVRHLGFGPALAAGLALAAWRPRWLPLAAAAAALDIAMLARRLGAAGLPAPLGAGLAARAEGWTLYHAGRQLSRYYALPALLAALSRRRGRPQALALLAGSFLAPGLWDWARLRPGLALPQFVAAHALDEAGYHAGVIGGCLRERSARALAVRLRLRAAR